MYESYWQLETRPFEHSGDARFHFPAQAQLGAQLKLRYALENRRGAAVLAGESGLGKTRVAEALLRELDDSFAPRVHIVFPQMPAEQLLTCLADQLTGETEPLAANVDQTVRRIERALRDNAAGERHAVIVLDEAHLLRDLRALEAIRLLMNFQVAGQPLATFLLVGQTSLILNVRRLPALDERIAVSCVLTRFSREESERYIQHRLTAAGAKREIFDPSALEAIYQFSGGIPRRINRLCDLALLVGYGEELPVLSAGHIESIQQELIGAPAAA